MVTRRMMTRSLPAFLLLMAIAVILILSGSAGTGFELGLIVVGIVALLLASMFIDEVSHFGARRPTTPRSRHRRTQASGF